MKSNPLKIAIIIFVLLSVGFVHCKHHPDLGNISTVPTDTSTIGKPCNPDSVYFVNDILPIIASNCAKSGCHDVATHTEGLILNSYSGIMKIVKKFQPDNSDLYEVITETDPDKLMPPPPNNAPLTAAQIALIYKWIMQGAPNNECTDCDTVSVSFAQDILPIINQTCIACHSGSAPSAGIWLTNYAEVKAQVLNGKLIPAVKRTGSKPMPPAASLPACSINKIAAWVNAGALDN
jgi:mono/diheme cytochrome c family protein